MYQLVASVDSGICEVPAVGDYRWGVFPGQVFFGEFECVDHVGSEGILILKVVIGWMPNVVSMKGQESCMLPQCLIMHGLFEVGPWFLVVGLAQLSAVL